MNARLQPRKLSGSRIPKRWQQRFSTSERRPDAGLQQATFLPFERRSTL